MCENEDEFSDFELLDFYSDDCTKGQLCGEEVGSKHTCPFQNKEFKAKVDDLEKQLKEQTERLVQLQEQKKELQNKLHVEKEAHKQRKREKLLRLKVELGVKSNIPLKEACTEPTRSSFVRFNHPQRLEILNILTVPFFSSKIPRVESSRGIGTCLNEHLVLHGGKDSQISLGMDCSSYIQNDKKYRYFTSFPFNGGMDDVLYWKWSGVLSGLKRKKVMSNILDITSNDIDSTNGIDHVVIICCVEHVYETEQRKKFLQLLKEFITIMKHLPPPTIFFEGPMAFGESGTNMHDKCWFFNEISKIIKEKENWKKQSTICHVFDLHLEPHCPNPMHSKLPIDVIPKASKMIKEIVYRANLGFDGIQV